MNKYNFIKAALMHCFVFSVILSANENVKSTVKSPVIENIPSHFYINTNDDGPINTVGEIIATPAPQKYSSNNDMIVLVEQDTNDHSQININGIDTSITPTMLFYRTKMGNDNITFYHRYAQHFLDTKINGNTQMLKQILTTQEKYLKYYEAGLKSQYNYYFGNKTVALYQVEKTYDRAFNRLYNSFEGLAVQEIYIQELILDKKELVGTSYCKTINKITDSEACLISVATISCLKNDKSFSSQMIEIVNNKNTDKVSDYLVKYCQYQKSKYRK